jgi:hypothetical protein
MFDEHMRFVDIRKNLENEFLDRLRDAFKVETDKYHLTDAEINIIEDLVVASDKYEIRSYTGQCSVCRQMINEVALFDKGVPSHVYKCINIDLDNLVITIRKDGLS